MNANSENIYLNTPFTEKDIVKSLGARWDMTRKQWYVLPDANLKLFKKWLPEFHDVSALESQNNASESGLNAEISKAQPRDADLCSVQGVSLAELLNRAGMLSPGNSPGMLTVLGDYDQQDDGWLHIEVGGLIAPGFDYDLLSVSGNAKLGGTLEVSLFNNYEPGIDDFLTFLTAGSITGHFDHFIFPTFNGMTFDLALDANSVGLITRPVPIPGALWLFSSAIALIFRVGVRGR